MTRTTISLHESVFGKVRKVAQESHSALGETITELLNLGLEAKSAQIKKRRQSPPFHLKTYAMGKPMVSLEDKEALNAILDRGDP